jgi:hypothetical protein
MAKLNSGTRVYGNLTVDTFANVTGNVTADYFLGNGALLTGITASGSSYSNVQVETYLPTYTGNVGKIYYDPNNGFVGFNDTSPDFVYDFLAPAAGGELLHIETGVATQAYFGAQNYGGLRYAAGVDQNYAFSGSRDRADHYVLMTNGEIRANIHGSTGNVIFTNSVSVTDNLLVTNLAATGSNITVKSNMTFFGKNLLGMSKLGIGTEDVGTDALAVIGNAYFDEDVTIMGNLFVNGNVTTINANNLILNDSVIYLADDNQADTIDIGFIGSFNNVVRYQHTGFVRDATDGTWKLFANVVPEPTSTVDFTNATYSNLQVGNIQATYFTGNGAFLTGLSSSYSNVQVATYLPTYSGVLGSSNLQVTGGGTFTGTLTVGASGFINSGGNVISGGTMRDSKGDVRASPINSQPGSYTAVAADAGKTIVESLLGSTITFNASVFAAGDMVSVINTSAGSITLVQGTNVTLRLAGSATTGNRTVATNGLATVICSVGGATPTFYCSGAGLT